MAKAVVESQGLSEMGERAADLSAAWPGVTDTVRAAVDDNFENQGTPVFGPWEQSKRAMRDGGLTLVDTNNLRENALGVVEEGATTLTLACDVEYAVEVTEGKTGIPERPFAQIGEDTVAQVAQQVLDHVVGQ